MDRDILLERREERRLEAAQEECEHCWCCRKRDLCCWCGIDTVGYDPGDECDYAYDNYQDDLLEKELAE